MAKDKDTPEHAQAGGKAEEKVDPRQKQADHFAALRAEMQAVVDDPDSTPEEVAEANKTIENMNDNLKRLADRYTVTPTSI